MGKNGIGQKGNGKEKVLVITDEETSKKMVKIYICKAIQTALIIFWTVYLWIYTDSLKSIYGICGVAGIAALLLLMRFKVEIERWQIAVIAVSAALFGLAVCLANYKCMTIPAALLIWMGGVCVAGNVIGAVYQLSIGQARRLHEKTHREGKKIYILFGACMLSVCIIDFIYLFLIRYPGCMNSDAIIQVTNGLYDIRANHFPYVHTMFLQLFIRVGLWISGELNLGIALYSCFQILFMSFCFAWAVTTLYEAGFSKILVGIVWAIYAIMPYHIAYSCMIWKDVLFGGAVLLFLAALYREIYRIGNHGLINLFGIMIGGTGMALLRNNGWYALAVTFLIILLLFKKHLKRGKISVFVVLLFTWILTHPVYQALDVEPSELTESLSIPIQQIARVITEEGIVSEEQREALNKLIDVDQVPELYEPGWSDPVKFAVDYKYLAEHKMEYFQIWADIGIRNPLLYGKAWIDQTKGYWNGGYSYWVWYTTINENWFKGYGSITQNVVFERGAKLVDWCMNLFMEQPVFDVFRSIGLWVWITGMCFVLGILRRNKAIVVMALPVLAVILTLIVATPVYSEFRYAYAVFTGLPFIFAVSVFSPEIVAEKTNE